MGIQDRDYYREGSGRFLDAWGRQGATVWLIVITCVVFFVQCLGGPIRARARWWRTVLTRIARSSRARSGGC